MVLYDEMTDSIKDLLQKKNFDQPDEIIKIKNYVIKKFGEEPAVKVTPSSVVISVSNSALAGALRLELHKLENQLDSEKRLIIKIN